MKNSKTQAKGPWVHRFAVRLFSVLLAILIYWLLGFVDDIGSLPGPDYEDFEREHLDQAALKNEEELEKQIQNINRKINARKSRQGLLGESTNSLRTTIDELLELQKLSLEKGLKLAKTEQETFAESLGLFLSNQKRYQAINEEIATLMAEETSLRTKVRLIGERLDAQRKSVWKQFEVVRRRHELNRAFLQLLVLIPILLVAAFLVIRQRASIYFPIFVALEAAVLCKVGFVIHERFPTRIFRYILIWVSLVAVTRLLVYFIRSVASPKIESLIKQYREAYERFLCPVCEYPIRRGPRKHLYWDRRTVKKLAVPQPSDADDASYVCPVCGTSLFEECSSCHSMRHSLLPSCEHCGAKKETDSVPQG